MRQGESPHRINIQLTLIIVNLLFCFVLVSRSNGEVTVHTDENGVMYFHKTESGIHVPSRRNIPATLRHSQKRNQIFATRMATRGREKKYKVAKKTSPNTYSQHVKKMAAKYRLDPNLIWAVMGTESNFKSRAVSPKGARGLMQLMPATARYHGVTDSFDPYQNIEGGARHLRFLLNFFKEDLTLALAAYNAGEERVLFYGGIPPYRETRNYVRAVLGRLNKLSKTSPVSTAENKTFKPLKIVTVARNMSD